MDYACYYYYCRHCIILNHYTYPTIALTFAFLERFWRDELDSRGWECSDSSKPGDWRKWSKVHDADSACDESEDEK